MFRTIVTSSAICALLAVPVRAAGVAFPSPEGWSHVSVPPATDATRQFDQWHIAGDIATVLTFAMARHPTPERLRRF